MINSKFTEIENKIKAGSQYKNDNGIDRHYYNQQAYDYLKEVIVDDNNKVYNYIAETSRTFICEKDGFIEKIKKNNGKIAVALCIHGGVGFNTIADDYCYNSEIVKVVY